MNFINFLDENVTYVREISETAYLKIKLTYLISKLLNTLNNCYIEK